ncbi:MAG: hypothetical protein JWM68_638 [Verrucomicrobiales bacterium]|nr:hypothetical protein [Verrucomicrobiales bacterium]
MKRLTSISILLSITLGTICNAEPVIIKRYSEDSGPEKDVPRVYVADSERIEPYLRVNLFQTPMPMSVQAACDAAVAFWTNKVASLPPPAAISLGGIKHCIIHSVASGGYSKDGANQAIGCPYYLVTVFAVQGELKGYHTELLVLPDMTVLESRVDPRYEARRKK